MAAITQFGKGHADLIEDVVRFTAQYILDDLEEYVEELESKVNEVDEEIGNLTMQYESLQSEHDDYVFNVKNAIKEIEIWTKEILNYE